MSDQDIVLAVVDDAEVRGWLTRILGETCRLEQVSGAELMRALRMLEATGSQLVLVEVSHEKPDQALAIVSALNNAVPWVMIVTLIRHPDEPLLLRCMRAGARDCIVLGGDATEARDRLREHLQLKQPMLEASRRLSRNHNLLLVASASPVVDTSFFSQELMLAIQQQTDDRLLAIDMQASRTDVFYLDKPGELDLSQLLQKADTLDDTLVKSALGEFRPGLRLLRGGRSGQLDNVDQSADLFITLNRLMDMFDTILVNLGTWRSHEWLRVLGIHARDLLLVMHPQVNQAKATHAMIADWKPFLGRHCDMKLVLDGVENGVEPSPERVASHCDVPFLGGLPMEWRHRLESKNLGQPMLETFPNSRYSRSMQRLAADLMDNELPPGRIWQWLNPGTHRSAQG